MHIPIRRLLAAALLLLLGVSSMALADEAADRAALEAATQAWTQAFNARKAEALVSLTTEDVVLLDPSLAPVSGRAAHQALREALGVAKGKITNATKELVIAGDLAWRIGALAHQLPGGEVLGRGQSLEIWKRVNGEWKIHRQMSSSILAQPRLLPRPMPPEPVLDTPAN
jgi:ketosteroid isomerase-like protein